MRAWRALQDGSVLVAQTPRRMLEQSRSNTWILFTVLLGIMTALGAGLANMLLREIDRGLGSLRSKAVRMAQGDFSQSENEWESDDEFGELSRSFDSVQESVREIFTGLAKAVDRVG